MHYQYWNPKLAAYDLQDYKYFWFEEKVSTTTNEYGVELCVYKEKIRSSSHYYINAYVETLEDIKARNSRHDNDLINRMENLDWNKVVRGINPEHNWVYHFKDGDFLVDLEGNVI